MRHPSFYFIKYLLLDNQTDINKILMTHNLPIIKEENIKQLTFMPPNNFNPHDLNNKSSINYIKKEKVYNLFHKDRITEETIDLLDNLDIREVVEQLLLSKLDPIEIAKKINSKWKILYTAEAIDRYRHYFWNTKLMKTNDWLELFKDPKDKNKIKNILKHGPTYTLQILGFIQKTEAKEILRDLLSICARITKEIASEPCSVDTIKSISLLEQTVNRIDDKLSSTFETNKDIMTRYQSYAIENSNKKIPAIEDTAKLGNYSNGLLLNSAEEITKESMKEEYTEPE